METLRFKIQGIDTKFRDFFGRLLWVFVVIGVFSACRLMGNADVEVVKPVKTDTPVVPAELVPTARAVPASAVPTAVPTAAPTSTPVILPTAVSLPIEIRFRLGGTSAFFQKPIQPGERHLYTLQAMAGQTLILAAASPDNTVFLGVRGLDDGVELLSVASQRSDWSGALPKSQVYEISLETSQPDTYYFLGVEVPAVIAFAPGAVSAAVPGYIEIDPEFYPGVMTRVRYLVQGAAGQTMAVVLSSDQLDQLSMGITGQGDGQPYLRYEVKNSGGSLVLPVTQGYYLDVYAVGGSTAEFSLLVEIQ